MQGYRIILILIVCFAIVLLADSLRHTVRYRWWQHTQRKKRAWKVLQRWSAIRAGEAKPRTREERELTVMTEWSYMKAVKNMLWDMGLENQAMSLWGSYTAERPYAKINVEWQETNSEDKVIYDRRPKVDDTPPLVEQKKEASL